MYPVSFFYFVFDSNTKEPLRDYYKRLGLSFSNYTHFHHLRIFAITMVDRFITKVAPEDYIFVDKTDKRDLEVFNSATILILSHFGGWSASTNTTHSKNMVNIVMQETMKDGIKDIETELGFKSTVNVIDINKGAIAVSIAIANALMKDEIVAIMGDRALNESGTALVKFFGEEAYFNKNPFQIAYKMKKPLVAYFIVLTGIQSYEKILLKIPMDYEAEMDIAIKNAMNIYVKKYEELLVQHPEQWLNFYDFWQKN